MGRACLPPLALPFEVHYYKNSQMPLDIIAWSRTGLQQITEWSPPNNNIAQLSRLEPDMRAPP